MYVDDLFSYFHVHKVWFEMSKLILMIFKYNRISITQSEKIIKSNSINNLEWLKNRCF